jgi:Flp pilus assembly protein TadD
VGLLEEALRIRVASLGAENPRTAQALHDLGLALLAAGEIESAERRLREALRVRRTALSRDHPDVAATLVALGRLLRTGGQLDESRVMLVEAGDLLGDRSDPLREELRAEMDALDAAQAAIGPRGER